MSVDFGKIRRIVSEIGNLYPNLSTGHHLSANLRYELQQLADACGLPYHLATKADDNALISVYLVARKDPMGGARVADRLKLILDPVPSGLLNGESLITKAPPSSSDVSLNDVRRMIKTEVREGALEPLQIALETQSQSLREAFDGMLETARNEYMSDMEQAAHNAAVKALQTLTPTRLEVKIGETEVKSLGLVHKKTPQIIQALAAGLNVYLHGPAGSGKTTVAHKAAEAFGLEFRFAAKVESEYQLMGFKDAKGDTVRTQFREAYEHGGVFLFDEMDASSPSAVVALNAALANGVCPFPDAIVKRHPQFYCIGAGNTKLTGANRQYAGRNQLDAASIDRFAFIEFGYDDELERALAADSVWCGYVQAVRAAVAERGINHLVTPRATYDGCKLLAAGFDWDTVAGMVVFKGLDADTRTQIENGIAYSKDRR